MGQGARGPLTAAVGEPVGKRNRLIAPASEGRQLGVELLGKHVIAAVARAGRQPIHFVIHQNRKLHPGRDAGGA